ncbi:branched-chain amino acid ABC transporter permease [Mesorhizobium microcysteis]|uniref:Branched-chain amino acid ABC transporter permease n=1 Tax=Neoaquamicrobium microcysteis TaxID=2682781 RepID=A0A5D4GZD7_9HYPH|nr:branched-chain amino acid ABC transporter permease [Mesorhizobium microcysteis]TYR33412.1 branched-chain amino acid ABC transporter permease [Mesorhizobium microcysteis]
MFYRRAGIRHTRYQDERQIWPLPFDRGLVIAVFLLALAAPFFLDRLYLVGYMLPWIIWSTAALGLNFLMGGAGQIHLGYGAVIAIGAYGSVHMVRSGIPFEIAMIGGGLLSASVGIVFGAAALRVKGLYLAMATLAMQYIVDFVIVHFPTISGGTQATIQVPRVSFLGLAVVGDAPTYYVALFVCIVVTLFMLNVKRTSLGRALAAVREKDYAAAIIGVNTFRYKLLAFWVSSFIGGVVGSVLAVCYYRAISPDQFHLELSIQLVAMVIVGGLGSVLGSFFGAALILFAPILLNQAIGFMAGGMGVAISTDLRSHVPLMLYGAMIIGFLLWEPLGLAKIYSNIRNYFLVWPFRHARQ